MRGLRAMLGIAGLSRGSAGIAEAVRNALAAAVDFTSARRGVLVLRDGDDEPRLVSHFRRGSGSPGAGRPDLLVGIIRRAVSENRSSVLTAGPEGASPTETDPPCSAMAVPIRDWRGKPGGAVCVYHPRREGGFVRADRSILEGFATEISAALDADRLRRRVEQHEEHSFATTFAAQIHHGLMPEPCEDLGACEAGFALPNASELDGHVLRLVRHGDGSHAVLAGRVSGRGAPAALVAVKIGEAFRLLAPTVRGAAELLQALDEAAAEGLRHEMRASAAVLVLNADGSQADVALAGCSCMCLGAFGTAAWCPDEGRPLGVRVPGARPAPPATTSARLGPGDGVLLLTSGCLNARGPTGESYGTYRVEAFARANAGRPAGDFAGALAADIDRFRAGAARKRDGAIAFVRRKTAA